MPAVRNAYSHSVDVRENWDVAVPAAFFFFLFLVLFFFFLFVQTVETVENGWLPVWSCWIRNVLEKS
jgi:hypothetical protein